MPVDPTKVSGRVGKYPWGTLDRRFAPSVFLIKPLAFWRKASVAPMGISQPSRTTLAKINTPSYPANVFIR
jgi:hypothetical protein